MKNKYFKLLFVLVISLIAGSLWLCTQMMSLHWRRPRFLILQMKNVDDEALMMEFAECLRNEGMEITDPTVDADGNIQMPELVEGATATKEEWIAAYEVCGEIIENITFKEKEVDRTAQLEQYLEIAACMNEAGFDVGEPTAETLDTWMADLKEHL